MVLFFGLGFFPLAPPGNFSADALDSGYLEQLYFATKKLIIALFCSSKTWTKEGFHYF